MEGLGIMWGPVSLGNVFVDVLELVVIVGGVFYLCRRIKRNIND